MSHLPPAIVEILVPTAVEILTGPTTVVEVLVPGFQGPRGLPGSAGADYTNPLGTPPDSPTVGESWQPSDAPMVVLRWDGSTWAARTVTIDPTDGSIAAFQAGSDGTFQWGVDFALLASMYAADDGGALLFATPSDGNIGVAVSPVADPTAGAGVGTSHGIGTLLLTPTGSWRKTGPLGTDWAPLGGGGGGAVDSVNGQTGTVTLDAGDVGAATSAQGALADTAVQPGDLPSFGDVVTHDAFEFATVSHDHSGVYDPAGTAATAVSNHAGAVDPHGDRAYADGLIAAADAMVLKGVIDCSASPNYPAADKGWTWRVSVAGKIGGASGPSVEAGDMILCLTDSTSTGDHAGVGANWGIIQTNIGVLSTVATTGAYNDLSGKPTLGTAAAADTGIGASNVILGNDARLTDARTPVAHNHAASEVTSGTLDIARIPTGATSSTVAIGNDSRLSDARTPTAHAASHAVDGGDAITIAQSQVTDLTTDLSGKAAASHAHAGTDITSGTIAADRLGSGGGGAGAKVLADNQTWITPPAGYTTEEAQDAAAAAIVTNATHVGGLTAAYNDASNAINLTVARSVTINCCPVGTTISVGDGKAYLEIPASLNGLNLTGVAMTTLVASTSGIPTIQIARGRASGAGAHSYVDMLTTKLTVDQGEYRSSTAATAAVIDTANDDVLTGDIIRIDCDVAGTSTQGVLVTLSFGA